MPKLTKDIKIKRIKDKLLECYNCDASKETIFITLIDELAWQIFTLQDCKENIKEQGYMVLFEQGKQSMYIANPLQKIYDQTVKNMSITIKSLESIGTKNNADKDNKNGTGAMAEFLKALKSAREEN